MWLIVFRKVASFLAMTRVGGTVTFEGGICKMSVAWEKMVTDILCGANG